MEKNQVYSQILNGNYCGRILKETFSKALKRRVANYIILFQGFDSTGSPGIPYISAWQVKKKRIWYEFVSKQMIALLSCDYDGAAEAFGNSILERRIYEYRNTGGHVDYEILNEKELHGNRVGLRETVEKNGFIEAIYKCHLPNGTIIWLKDQATIKTFKSDDVCISLGCLTFITKLMETEEHLKRTREALRKSEKKFREQAVHDNLTGLYNTRYLYKALSKLISNSRAGKRPFSLIFMDIDDFKEVVDTHGHLNASRALQEMAATVNKAISDPAYAVAYGGDEFVIVLPDVAKHTALEIAHDIRLSIRKTVYLTRVGLQVRLRASFGVSTFPDDTESLTEILALADQAMFHVKKRGKNSVGDIARL